MPGAAKSLEDRVADLESIYIDMPELLNTRFERVNLHLNEMSSRLDLLDRQMGALIRDMRDLRGGVTRQLVEQDKRLATIEQRIAALESTHLQLVERLTHVEQTVVTKLDEILRRLPG